MLNSDFNNKVYENDRVAAFISSLVKTICWTFHWRAITIEDTIGETWRALYRHQI